MKTHLEITMSTGRQHVSASMDSDDVSDSDMRDMARNMLQQDSGYLLVNTEGGAGWTAVRATEIESIQSVVDQF